MDHEEAKRKHTGGKILGFFYKLRVFGTVVTRAAAVCAPPDGVSGAARRGRGTTAAARCPSSPGAFAPPLSASQS